jgi:hypothetical protein
MATLVRPEPSFEEVAEIRRYWDANYERFLREYPEQFVAVKDGQVVAHDPDLTALFHKLQDLKLDPRTDVAIEFISAEADTLIL